VDGPGSAAERYRGATAMVFGASGFIGRWVASTLASRDVRLSLVVRDRAAIPGSIARTSQTSIAVADLSREEDVRQAIEATRPSIVFNLAGYGVDRGERDEELARTINAGLPRWIVEALAEHADREWAGQRLVHVGSALEYGEIGGDLSEDSSPNPTTVYGQTKLAGTMAVRHACERHGVRAVTARLFTVYGAGEHAGRLLPTLIDATTHNARVPLSAGRQKRDFTYVGDVVEGLLRLGLCTSETPGAVINLATGRLTEVREFVVQAARVLGVAPDRLDFGALPTRSEEMQHDPVSIAKLRQLLNWSPRTSVAEGVRLTVGQLGL